MTDVRVGQVVHEEKQFGAATSAEADPIAIPERPFGDLLVVDESTAARPAILENASPVVQPYDLSVLARHIGANRSEIAVSLAANAEHRFVDDDEATAERIVDLKTGVFAVRVSGMVRSLRLHGCGAEL